MYCDNCGEETNHRRVDMGNGYSEYGSSGATHKHYVYECQRCGNLSYEEN